MAVIRSAIFALVFYPVTMAAALIALIVSLFGKRALAVHVRGWARFHRFCTRSILGIGSRIEGAMPTGPAIVAMKHESMYETIEALLMLDFPVVVLKKELADIPGWGHAAKLYGVIVVDRQAGASAMRHMLQAGRNAATQGRPILIFPEGTRVPHGEQVPIRAGFAGLYRALNLPVVPVACDSGRVWPRASFLKYPGTVTFRIGETIPPGLSRAEVETRLHTAINALNSPR